MKITAPAWALHQGLAALRKAWWWQTSHGMGLLQHLANALTHAEVKAKRPGLRRHGLTPSASLAITLSLSLSPFLLSSFLSFFLSFILSLFSFFLSFFFSLSLSLSLKLVATFTYKRNCCSVQTNSQPM